MEKMSIDEIMKHLDTLYPDAHCELNHRNNYEMAIAVILSAQTTDASVNKVTPALFEKYPTIHDLAHANIEDVKTYISALGLYQNKARAIIGFAKGVEENFDGQIPKTIDELVTLNGVGRKCANVIQSECFQIPALAVDTHVSRIARRLGLCYQKDDVDTIERKLKKKFPKERWIKLHHQMIFFGRYMCHSRNPKCTGCPFISICHEKKKNL